MKADQTIPTAALRGQATDAVTALRGSTAALRQIASAIDDATDLPDGSGATELELAARASGVECIRGLLSLATMLGQAGRLEGLSAALRELDG